MKFVTTLSFILVIVGALNWLLVGLFSFNLVAFLFGASSVISRIIYSVVGLASFWIIYFLIMYKPLKLPTK